jgi:Cof subfamily protein (haloacid dehalogenase superfamily)
MKRKYLFFDIDGTLACGGYGNTYIPDSANEALQKLREAGHFLSICTGRSQSMAESFIELTDIHNMVSDGGYGLTLEDKFLGIEPLNKEDVIALIDECKEKGFPWGLSTENSMVRSCPDESFYEFTHDTYMGTKVVEGLDPRKCDEIYKAYVACYYPGEFSLKSLDKLPWCRFHKEYFFVEPTDKARGIRKMMDMLEAPYEDVIVFGDAANDLSMFVDDWTCVAMGNACEELKEKADLITTDADKHGIWNACVELGLFEGEKK